jgi:hypothetical protein
MLTQQSEVQSRAAQLRIRAIQLQLLAAFNFCSTAQNALVLGRVQCFREAIENARHTAQTVRVHLDEPHHVPADSIAGIRDRLAELERQLSRLEARFQP